MSPAFKKSVCEFADSLLETEFGVDETLGDREKQLLSGMVYRFIVRLTSKACDASLVKGRLDAECFTFAARGNLAMYKRMTRLLAAHGAVSGASAVDI